MISLFLLIKAAVIDAGTEYPIGALIGANKVFNSLNL